LEHDLCELLSRQHPLQKLLSSNFAAELAAGSAAGSTIGCRARLVLSLAAQLRFRLPSFCLQGDGFGLPSTKATTTSGSFLFQVVVVLCKWRVLREFAAPLWSAVVFKRKLCSLTSIEASANHRALPSASNLLARFCLLGRFLEQLSSIFPCWHLTCQYLLTRELDILEGVLLGSEMTFSADKTVFINET